jgi:hypothetical protein
MCMPVYVCMYVCMYGEADNWDDQKVFAIDVLNSQGTLTHMHSCMHVCVYVCMHVWKWSLSKVC